MTLDAWSHATLADVKRGGCCDIAHDSLISLAQVGKGRPLYVGVPGESDHTLLVIVVSRGRARFRQVLRLLQRPFGRLCETDHASLTKYRLIGPVM